MRNKRLIILICVLGGLAAVIIIMSAVFTVYNTDAVCGTTYTENEGYYQTISEVNAEVKTVADKFKFKNIFLFNKDELIDAVNNEVSRAEAYDVECVFPNKVVVKHNLVNRDLQFKVGEKYIVTGASGKIVRVNDYDSTSQSGGHYDETLISVTPYASPDSAEVCKYAYAESSCYDMRALKIILGLPSVLVDSSGRRVFDKAVYSSIDLSNKNTIVIRTRNGVAFKFLGGANALAEKVRTMASWYVFASDADTTRGIVTISDVNPEKVIYSKSGRL